MIIAPRRSMNGAVAMAARAQRILSRRRRRPASRNLYISKSSMPKALTPGIFLAFLYAMFNAYMPLKRIGQVYQQFQYAQGASTQVFAYLDHQEEKSEQPGASTLPPFQQEIVFDDVSFAYGQEAAVILQDIRLRARRGEVVALVGSSGA